MRPGNRRWTFTVETERVVVVSRHGRFSIGWCAHCGVVVDMWTEADVLALARWSPDDLERMLAAGTLHGTEMDDGSLRLCANALRAQLARHAIEG
jgi:hypothetical protein